MIKVLIVEDEPPNQKELEFLINHVPKFEIAAKAASGKAAIQLIKVMEPDVIFLDIGLPDINGVKLAELIRAIHNKVHIVFVTASEEYESLAQTVNPTAFLLKPVDEVKLYNVLDKIISTNYD